MSETEGDEARMVARVELGEEDVRQDASCSGRVGGVRRGACCFLQCR